MRNHITSTTKLNEIKMLIDRRQFKNKVFVIVEGKTDIKLFRKLFNTNYVQIESVDGKDNVKQIIKSLIEKYTDRILGISDADFDHLLNIQHDQEIYLTDTHDIETMIMSELGLDSIISEYAKDDYHESLKQSLLTKSINVAYDVGLFKLLNRTNNLFLSFKEVDLSDFIAVNKFNVAFDKNGYIEAILDNSPNSKIPDRNKSTYILNQIENLRSKNHDDLMVCSGHDLTLVVSKILKQKDLTLKSNLENSDIESMLRISYGINDFSKSKLFEKINNWQKLYCKSLLVI